MRLPVTQMVLLFALAGLAACQKPDVGQPCDIQWGTEGQPPPDPVKVEADFFESGNVACENLVCIVSPTTSDSEYARGPGVGYCSKPCVSNQDCFQSETGLVCRQMVLDPVFLAQLSPELKEQYLGEVQFSSYCAVP